MREPAGGRNAVVIEDDPSISELLRLYLSREGYVVHATPLGEAGAALVRDTDPALVVLDLMLPDGSGFDVLKAVRAFSQAPVIILTARDAEQDKILGLELGTDDYMVKPFSPGELVARARAVQRRMGAQDDHAAAAQVLGCIELLPAERTLVNRGLALTRDRLLEEVWGYSAYGGGWSRRSGGWDTRPIRKRPVERSVFHPSALDRGLGRSLVLHARGRGTGLLTVLGRLRGGAAERAVARSSGGGGGAGTVTR